MDYQTSYVIRTLIKEHKKSGDEVKFIGQKKQALWFDINGKEFAYWLQEDNTLFSLWALPKERIKKEFYL